MARGQDKENGGDQREIERLREEKRQQQEEYDRRTREVERLKAEIAATAKSIRDKRAQFEAMNRQ